MKLLKKIFAALLILLTLNLYLPDITFAEASITKHKPEIKSTPEQEIPTIKEKKTSGWTWLILVALIGGAAAAAGGGGDDNPPPPPPGSDTGDVAVTW